MTGMKPRQKVLLTILVLVMAAVASTTLADDACLYAIDIGTNNNHNTRLYDLDPQTGQASNPRSTGMGSAIGLAYGQDGFLYAVTTSISSQPKSLYRINPVSGAATLIGSLGLSPGLLEGDLAFHPNGTLYGISNQRKIFTVDLATGAATSLPDIGSFNADYSNLSFHNNGTLYALDNTISAGQLTNSWQTLNANSGTVLSTSNLSYYAGPLGGMDFDGNSGDFWIIDSKFPNTSLPGTNSLYRIDTQGNRSLVGSLGVSSAFAGLAACPVSPKPDLVITDVDFLNDCKVDFEISNIGAGDANGWFSFNGSPLHVPAWGTGPHTGWSGGINGLPAGQSTTQTWGTIKTFGPQIDLHLDPSNAIAESDEVNNINSFPVPQSCRYQPSSCVTPPPNMTGWYPFDETGGVWALDIKGLNFGRKRQGPTPTTGKVAGGLEFDGINDFVRVRHSNRNNIDGPGTTGAFSIDAWIYPHSTAAGSIVSKIAGSSVPGLSRGYDFNVYGNSLAFVMTTHVTSPFTFIVYKDNVINVDEWNHVAVTMDHATQSTHLYVNGVAVRSTLSYPQMVTRNSQPLHIGARKDPDTGVMDSFFDGVIDEVEIFNRALTNDEVYLLYAAQSYGKCKWPCPALTALSQGDSDSEMSATAVAKVLYQVRDERLATTNNGLYFTSLFQQHRLRIAYLMLRSSELRKSAETVLHTYAPGLEQQLEGAGSEVLLDDSMITRVMEFANLLIETDLIHDGGELAEAVDKEVSRIDWQKLPGKNFDELWLYMETLPLDR